MVSTIYIRVYTIVNPSCVVGLKTQQIVLQWRKIFSLVLLVLYYFCCWLVFMGWLGPKIWSCL